MRKICYVTGTRADFGLMKQTLLALNQDSDINLSLCVTAMHLLEHHGLTVKEIYEANFNICAEIPVNLDNNSSTDMVTAIGHEIIAMTEVFHQQQPDIVLLLGDRGETLAAAIAAAHLSIHIVHIHGGERSGTVDEMVRHCISKLSHYHFTATKQSKQRLIKMGEKAEHIFITGAPGLDGLDDLDKIKYIHKADLFKKFNFDTAKKTGLIVFHPVVQEVSTLYEQFENIIKPLLNLSDWQFLAVLPNADTGGGLIEQVYNKYNNHTNIKPITHLAREEYLSWLKVVDIMIGNSSSAIIEAASFNLPVINIGTRQNLREQSNNVINIDSVDLNNQNLKKILLELPANFNNKIINIYGDGKAAPRILNLLKSISLDKNILKKCNEY